MKFKIGDWVYTVEQVGSYISGRVWIGKITKIQETDDGLKYYFRIFNNGIEARRADPLTGYKEEELFLLPEEAFVRINSIEFAQKQYVELYEHVIDEIVDVETRLRKLHKTDGIN